MIGTSVALYGSIEGGVMLRGMYFRTAKALLASSVAARGTLAPSCRKTLTTATPVQLVASIRATPVCGPAPEPTSRHRAFRWGTCLWADYREHPKCPCRGRKCGQDQFETRHTTEWRPVELRAPALPPAPDDGLVGDSVQGSCE